MPILITEIFNFLSLFYNNNIARFTYYFYLHVVYHKNKIVKKEKLILRIPFLRLSHAFYQSYTIFSSIVCLCIFIHQNLCHIIYIFFQKVKNLIN